MISRSNSTALSGQVSNRLSGDYSSTASRLQTQEAAPSKPPLSPSFHFPSTHCVNFAQVILYRAAGFVIVAGFGLVFFLVALGRFPANGGGELEVGACHECYT
jgi:hypothetical protein